MNPNYVTAMFSALAGFVVMLGLLVFCFLISEVKQRVRAIFFFACITVPVVFYFTVTARVWTEYFPSVEILEPTPWNFALVAMFIFTFIWFGYLQFYFLVERGVSARILMHVLEKPEGIKKEDIQKIYSFEDVIKRRIDDMVGGGYLLTSNQEEERLQSDSGRSAIRYRNSRKGTWVGKIGRVFKVLFRLGRGG